MENDPLFRADKYLWCVRIFKTRSQAMDACKKGHVLINSIAVKPSRNIRRGEIINIKRPPVIYSYIVKDFPKNRVPHKLVVNYIDDVTSPKELKKLEIKETFFIKREKGTGRPTKKERRNIDKLGAY